MYEPAPRMEHQTVLVGNNMYVWAGMVANLPKFIRQNLHDSPEKREFLSNVEVFHAKSGDWICQPTSGIPPLGVSGYSCAAVRDTLHYFGAWCNHGDCFHNSLNSLSTLSLQWSVL